MGKKQTAKPVSSTVTGVDARIMVNIYSPGHDPEEFRLTIPNICGSANLLHRSPESIANAVIQGLRSKYGERSG